MIKKYNTLVLFGDSGSRISEIVRFTSLKKAVTRDELYFLQKQDIPSIMPASINGIFELEEDEDFMESSLFVNVRYDLHAASVILSRLQEIELEEAESIIEEERSLIDQIPRIDIVIYANKDNSPVEVASKLINLILKHANISDPRKYDYQEYKCLRSIWKKQNITLNVDSDE